MTTLLEAIDQFGEAAAQNAAGTRTTNCPRKLFEDASHSTTLTAACGRVLSDAAKHFSNLVPVLIAGDCE